jgi:hypothetical protein
VRAILKKKEMWSKRKSNMILLYYLGQLFGSEEGELFSFSSSLIARWIDSKERTALVALFLDSLAERFCRK